MSESNEIEIRCRECGNILTDEIKYDLGWHCMYPCDNITYIDDIPILRLLRPDFQMWKND